MTAKSAYQGRQLLGTAICIALAAVAVLLFVQNVRHYYFLADDAFISFRYAAHLVDGRGLVWNTGEYVEGYTNFLWVLLMAGSLALGIAPEVSSNAIGIGSGVLVLALLLGFAARDSSWRNPFIYLPILALAASRTFTAWCSGGLETMFFTLLVLCANLLYLRERERGEEVPLFSSAVFGVAALTRPEGVLFAAVAGLAFLVDVARRRRPLRAAFIWGLPCAAIVGTHLLWRHSYYGYWLPNTFYAKVPAAWWDQGLDYLALFAGDYQIHWFVPLAVLTLVLRRDFISAYFAALVVGFVTYVVAVGGDRYEFRFLVVILPYWCWLVGESLHQISKLGSRSGRSAGWQVAMAAMAATLLAALWIQATRVGSASPEAMLWRDGVTSIEAATRYGRERSREGKFLREMIDEGVLPSDLVIAVKGAGALPYYTDWPTVDQHGLNDVHIAHQPITRRGIIAHERDATLDYLRERHVVMIDGLNRLVHQSPRALSKVRLVHVDGRWLPLVAVRVRGHYLVFATPLDRESIRGLFEGFEIRF